MKPFFYFCFKIINIMSVEIKSKIKEVRKKQRVKQLTLANLIGVSRSTMWRIENDKQKATIDQLLRISTYLKCKIEQLYNY